MSGKLILVPTPIDEESILTTETTELILSEVKKGSKILVEEEKEGRRRWLRFGLPRETIADFVLFNEHSQVELGPSLVKTLKTGTNIVLMSDCGLPAFCDPGQELVNLCHKAGVTVTATSFSNSIALAVALSGFPHQRFIFEGFIPIKREERLTALKRIIKQPEVSIIMDTPYRLQRVLSELSDLNCSRDVFVGLDLNKKEEKLYRGKINVIKDKLQDSKREFILMIGPK